MISIIQSNYNNSELIKTSIDSVLNQSYQDFELIIIDDCSTDNSIEVINSYSDNRIRLIQNPINKGCGYCRYIGVKQSKGDFITFLDSDDSIEKDYLQNFIKAQNKYNADIIIQGTKFIFKDKVHLSKFEFSKYIGKKLALDKNLPEKFKFLHASLYKASLFKTVDYCKRRYIEDTPTFFKLLYLAKKVITIPACGYLYNKTNENSLTTTANECKNLIFSTLSLIDIIEFLNSQKDYQKGTREAFIAKMRELDKFIKTEDILKYKSELGEILIYFIKNFNF